MVAATTQERREIDILRPDEVAALLFPDGRREARGPCAVRTRSLIAVLYGAGLRISEALALLPKDLDLAGGTVTVQFGKGGRRRVSALLPDAVPLVAAWLERRARYPLHPTAPVFCTVSTGAVRGKPTWPGLPLRHESVRVTLNRLRERAGLHKRVHAHGFRHSHACLLRERGWDVEAIRLQLGHSSLLVTGRYLEHLGATDLPALMRGMGAVLPSR